MTDILWIAFILSNLVLLGSSRLNIYVRMVSAQGFLLGFLPWVLPGALTFHTLGLSLAGAALKGVVFPWLVLRAIERAGVRREVEPFVGFGTSLLAGLAALAAAFVTGEQLSLPLAVGSSRLVPVALFTMFVGLFLVIGRRKAVTQVLGYLVLENGISVLGLSLIEREPLVVELGLLLDAFAAVFIMGIILFHINQEFEHLDADQLNLLRDEG